MGTISTDSDGRTLVRDSTGTSFFDPDSCSHVFGYNGSNQLSTDTATDPMTGNVYVQTFSYTNGQLTGASSWVKQ